MKLIPLFAIVGLSFAACSQPRTAAVVQSQTAGISDEEFLDLSPEMKDFKSKFEANKIPLISSGHAVNGGVGTLINFPSTMDEHIELDDSAEDLERTRPHSINLDTEGEIKDRIVYSKSELAMNLLRFQGGFSKRYDALSLKINGKNVEVRILVFIIHNGAEVVLEKIVKMESAQNITHFPTLAEAEAMKVLEAKNNIYSLQTEGN